MNFQRLIKFWGILPVILFIIFSSCKTKKVEKNIIYEAILSDPRSFDPRDQVDAETYGIMYTIYNTLVEMDDSLVIQPAIAERWETKDFKEWKFFIRDGVYFHPDPCFGSAGTKKLTAYDVEYSLNRSLKPGGVGAFMLTDIVEGAEEVNQGKAEKASGIFAVDSTTLVIRLKQPYGKLLERLATPFFFIVPREAVDYYKDEFPRHPVGTGAYMFERYEPGNAVFLKKNPLFWKKDNDGKRLPYLDGLVFKIVRNPQLALNEFLSGNLDAVEVQPVFVDLLFENGRLKKEFQKYKVVENIALDVHFLAFNFKEKIFSNKNFRQALNYAIDKRVICERILNNLATPAIGILPPGVYSDVKRKPVYELNKEKAKEKLKLAGYDAGGKAPELELHIDNKQTTELMAQYVQATLKELGINIKLKKTDFGTLLADVVSGKSKFYYMWWEGTDPNPEIFMVQFKSNLLPEKGGYNFGRYNNKSVDNLFDAAVRELKPEKAKKLWLKLDSLLVEDAPWIFLYHTKRVRLLQPYISNYDNNPMQIRRYYTTTKSRL
ncbi:peptide/nickel transport system substrate-binding protein [Candidatus Kryptobacter tengchongensis]|nr:peptide/nickel transport system substrate-binding protein [Candidatus Kryptobacter tengchongensis]